MIYHVDENRRWGSYRTSSGPVNNDPSHKLVDLEEADGTDDLDNSINGGDAGDPFPGSSGNREFSDYSTPSSSSYDGGITGIKISNISSSSQNMTADIQIRKQYGYSLVYDELGITGWGWGYSDSVDSWGGVLFKPTAAGYLTEVDVGFRKGEIHYKILVYGSFNGSSPKNLLHESSGYAALSGWYTVSIDSLFFNHDHEFFIAEEISGQSYAISFDGVGVPSGRSYFSGDGVSYSSRIGDYGDINLRAKLTFSKNAAPVALSRQVTIQEDSDVNIVLIGRDVDGDSLTFRITEETSFGSLSLMTTMTDSSASARYTPRENFHGTDEFRYTVSDGIRMSDPASVQITIESVNDAPYAFDIVGPKNGSLVFIDDESLDDTLRLAWHPSYDIDEDDIRYIWRGSDHLASIDLPPFDSPFTYLIRPNARLEIEVPYSSLYSILDQSDSIHWSEPSELTGTWSVLATDGKDTTEAANGPFTLTIKEHVLFLDTHDNLPSVFSLHQNHPNPFNPTTTLRYDLPEQSEVVLTIYDVLGREVKTLVRGVEQMGFKSVQWDGADGSGKPVSAGVYLYQIKAGDFSQTRKMLLLR